MDITIDGRVIQVIRSDKNLIDVASRAKIPVPCACYRAGRQTGCCRACVVVVDGKWRYACTTLPSEGMRVVVDRKDLKAIRRRRLAEYRNSLKNRDSQGSCCSKAKTCCK